MYRDLSTLDALYPDEVFRHSGDAPRFSDAPSDPVKKNTRRRNISDVIPPSEFQRGLDIYLRQRDACNDPRAWASQWARRQAQAIVANKVPDRVLAVLRERAPEILDRAACERIAAV